MLLLITTATAAQTKKLVREGNELYRQQRYKDAAMLYQEALSKDPSFTPGLFNLGNSLYRQKDLEQSRKIMAAAAKSATDKGMFEIIHAGTNGGMSAKGRGLMDPTDPKNGLSPDEILKVIAWIRNQGEPVE